MSLSDQMAVQVVFPLVHLLAISTSVLYITVLRVVVAFQVFRVPEAGVTLAALVFAGLAFVMCDLVVTAGCQYCMKGPCTYRSVLP